MLAPEAASYLNQQPPQVQQSPQDDQAKQSDPRATSSTTQNTDNPKGNDEAFSNTIDSATQARTIIYEVRTTLHHFRDDRWDKLIRVRNQLMKMILVTGLLLYVLVEFAIIINVSVGMLKAAAILFFVGGLVGLFSRLYDQSKTDTSIDDFRLATARLIAGPLYSGLSAIGGGFVFPPKFYLSVTRILLSPAFCLPPNPLPNGTPKKTGPKKTAFKKNPAPTPQKQEK